MANYPKIKETEFGHITVGGKTYDYDIRILADGKVKKRKKSLAKEAYGTSHKIGPKELDKVCKGDPEVLFIGTGQSGFVELTDEGQQFLQERGIKFQSLPTPQIIEPYNGSRQRKAALIHVTC